MAISSAYTRGLVYSLLPRCRKNAGNPPDNNVGNPIFHLGENAPIEKIVPERLNMETGYGYIQSLGVERFDPVNDYIYAGHDNNLNSIQGTFSIWLLKPAWDTSLAYLFTKRLTTLKGILIAFLSGSLIVDLRNNDSSRITISSYASHAPLGVLHNLVIRYDLSKETDKVQIFINGNNTAYDLSGTLSNTLPDGLNSVMSCIGNNSSELTKGFSGDIHKFSYYNIVKTDQEIAELYNLGPDLGGLKLMEDGSLVAPTKNRSYKSRVKVSAGF